MTIKYGTVTGAAPSSVLEWMEAELQSNKPGKYTVVETRVSNSTYEYTLVFNDPREELMWRLKYG